MHRDPRRSAGRPRLARGARRARLAAPRYLEAAARAARFVLANLRDEEGGLLHSWRGGRAHVPAFLDDYAFLVEGLLDAARFDRRVLVERGVDAREIEVSVLGNEDPIASLPGEIQPQEEFYTYSAKYLSNTSRLIIPAELDTTTAEQIRQAAIAAYKAVDGAGMARVDFLLDRGTGAFYLGEMNTIPGFTSISMYAKLWEASGISYSELLDRLIQLALDRHAEKHHIRTSYGR